MEIQLSYLTYVLSHISNFHQQKKKHDEIALQNFHQKLKITLGWLKSIGCQVQIKSNENLGQASLCLPYNMSSKFCKGTCNLDIRDGDVICYF